jgi:phosphoribosylamine--glycine ligase
VVLASGSYPESYEKGKVITGLDAFDGKEDYFCFHAGTKFDDKGNVVTSGGRVLGIVALGSDLKQARAKAYEATAWVSFDKMYKRNDIGKALDSIEL